MQIKAAPNPRPPCAVIAIHHPSRFSDPWGPQAYELGKAYVLQCTSHKTILGASKRREALKASKAPFRWCPACSVIWEAQREEVERKAEARRQEIIEYKKERAERARLCLDEREARRQARIAAGLPPDRLQAALDERPILMDVLAATYRQMARRKYFMDRWPEIAWDRPRHPMGRGLGAVYKNLDHS